jgi:hypothetical protein
MRSRREGLDNGTAYQALQHGRFVLKELVAMGKELTIEALKSGLELVAASNRRRVDWTAPPDSVVPQMHFSALSKWLDYEQFQAAVRILYAKYDGYGYPTPMDFIAAVYGSNEVRAEREWTLVCQLCSLAVPEVRLTAMGGNVFTELMRTGQLRFSSAFRESVEVRKTFVRRYCESELNLSPQVLTVPRGSGQIEDVNTPGISQGEAQKNRDRLRQMMIGLASSKTLVGGEE